MTQPEDDDQSRPLAAILEHLTRLGEAGLRINDGLELDAVLQRVLDGARALTGARYGVLTTLDGAGRMTETVAHVCRPTSGRIHGRRRESAGMGTVRRAEHRSTGAARPPPRRVRS